MPSYTAYGLSIDSELSLPGVPSAASPANPDVRIREQPLDTTDLDVTDGWGVRASRGEFLLGSNAVGAVRIRDGREILIDPAAGVSSRTLRFVVLGVALGVLLHQRGHLVLHGCAVGLAGQTVGFLGPSGAGKSTLAAAFYSRGSQVYADDLTALSFETHPPTLLPGYPLLKLDSTAATRLEHLGGRPFEWVDGMEQGGETGDHPEKEFVRTSRAGAGGELDRLYILEDGPEVSIESMPPKARFLELVRHSYLARRLPDTGRLSPHFRQCSELVESVTVKRLRRPLEFEALPELLEAVEHDVEADGDR